MNRRVKAFGAIGAEVPLQGMEIERREVGNKDVAFEVLYCGICHSDLHAVRNDWGGTTYPIVPGHEIVGRVVKVGEDVTNFRIGDVVAVGCIVDSCHECAYCKEGQEQYCESGVTFSFNSPDRIYGGTTYGGFSKLYVCDEHYVLRMPAFKDLAAAAPLLCAGITVYSPLRHWKVSEGCNVGILGMGGLGHLAIKMAKAMGAYVTVFTTSPSKSEDAFRLGADRVVVSTDKTQMKACAKMDIIIDTVSAKHDVNAYLRLLKVDGHLVLVGLPAEPLEVGAFHVVNGRKSFSGSNIGGIAETQEMLEFCFEHGIVSEYELIKISDVNEAFRRLEKNDVRYRFVIDMGTL